MAEPEETAYPQEDGTILWQRVCDAPGCDKGLIYSPVRFCGRCGGDGWLVRREEAGAQS